MERKQFKREKEDPVLENIHSNRNESRTNLKGRRDNEEKIRNIKVDPSDPQENLRDLDCDLHPDVFSVCGPPFSP